MSGGKHKVQRILLELTNSDEDRYQADEREFSELVNTSFSLAMEQLLDDSDLAGTSIRIPRLELDLGTLQRPFRKEQIVSIFREKLSTALKAELERATQQPEQAKPGTAFDVLVYFLTHGSLPWWSAALPELQHYHDPLFRARLRDFLFSAKTPSIYAARLSKQLDFDALKLLLQELASAADAPTLQSLETVLSNLLHSEIQSRQKTGRALLQKIIGELLSSKGRLQSFSTLITSFIAQQPQLRALSLQQTAAYFESEQLATLPELAAIKQPLKEGTANSNFSFADPSDPEFAEQEQLLYHYLRNGSLPAGGFKFSQQTLEFLLTEFILKHPAKLGTQLQAHATSQRLFKELITTLPEQHIKTLIQTLGNTPGIQVAPLKDPSSPGLTVRAVAAVLLLNRVLKKAADPAELYRESKSLLPPATQQDQQQLQQLRALFTEEDMPALASNETAVTPKSSTGGTTSGSDEPVAKDIASASEETKLPDAVYFADLLHYLVKQGDWPWWGKLYLSAFGESQATAEQVAQRFESSYPAAFTQFSQSFLNAETKPALLFETLPAALATKILAQALPFFRNSLQETLEAVFALLAQKKGSGVQPAIAAQQLIFFIIDEKPAARTHFKDLVNRAITLFAVKLQLPLWEAYSILLKNYDTLGLKRPLLKEEAVALFAYHEQLEDQYLLQSQVVTSPNAFVVEHAAELDFISESHETLLHLYLAGNDAAVSAFPSAWALGRFITERLKHSPDLASVFQRHLKGDNADILIRLLRLETLSRESWIAGLLPQPEQQELQEALLPLLKKIKPAGDLSTLQHVLRSAFIQQSYWQRTAFDAERFKTLVQRISDLARIPVAQLQASILQALQGNEANAVALRQQLSLSDEVKLTENKTEETAAENSSFTAQLKEFTFKKQRANLVAIIQAIPGIDHVTDLLTTLNSITRKHDLLAWAKKISAISGQNSTERWIENLDNKEAESLVPLLQKALAPALETALKNFITQNKKTKSILALEQLLANETASEAKEQLLAFIEENRYADKTTYSHFIEQLNFSEALQTQLSEWLSNLPANNAFTEPQQRWAAQQKESLARWREELKFESEPAHPEEKNNPAAKTKEETGIINDTNDDSATIHEGKASKGKITQKEEPGSTKETHEANEQLNPQQSLNGFSAEGIADTALYFFFYRELPWWSSIKDLVEFEHVLQEAVLRAPHVIHQRWQAIAEAHTELFQHLNRALSEEDTTRETRKRLAKEDIKKLLDTDRHFLAAAAVTEGTGASLKSISDLLLPYFETADIDAELVAPLYRQVMVCMLAVAEPDIFFLLKEGVKAHPSAAAETWLPVMETAEHKETAAQQLDGALQIQLQQLEDGIDPSASEKGVSVTELVFSIAALNAKPAETTILNSWLALMEIFSGRNATELRDTLRKTNPSLEELRKETEISSQAHNTFLLPYSYYLGAAALLLDQAETFLPAQRKTALALVTQLFQPEALKGNPLLPFRLFFHYLETQGISQQQSQAAIEKLLLSELKPELKRILRTISGISTNTYEAPSYPPEMPQPLRRAKVQSTEEIVEKLIRRFRNKVPVLAHLREQQTEAQKQAGQKKVFPQPAASQLPELDPEGRMYVPNAGLVLLWPFLSRLFMNLGYTEKGKFIDEEKQLRAIHLSQYLVAFTEDHPEYTLVLNKLLCGLPLETPVERSVELNETEKAEAQNLISAVLMQWKEMNNTTPGNFQRTFLQREGVIWQKDGNWYVKTEHTPFDILLLKLPWGLSIIKYPWNNYLIFVEWKAMN